MEIKDLTGGLVLNVSPDALAKNQLQAAQNVTVTDTPGVVQTRKGRTAINDIIYVGATDIFYQNVLETPGIVAVGECLTHSTGYETSSLLAMWVGDRLIAVSLLDLNRDEDTPLDDYGAYPDYSTGHWDFTEYNGNLIFCSGNRNYRLADDMGCTLFAANTFMWEVGDAAVLLVYEADYMVDTLGMLGNPFLLATMDDIRTSQSWCCYEWERIQLNGGTSAQIILAGGKILAPLEVDFNVLTSTYATSSLGLQSYNLKLNINYLSIPCEIGGAIADAIAPAVALGAAGNPNGTYTYKITFVSQDGFETNESTASAQIIPANQKVVLTNVSRSFSRTGWKRRIYRNANGGATWKRVGEITNNDETTFTDDVADVDLGTAIPESNAPPPPFCAVQEHRSLLYGVRTYKPEEVWYCNDKSEWQYFDSLNYEIFGSNPSNGYALVSLGPYLVVIHDVKVFLLNTMELPNVVSQALIEDGARSSKAVFDIGDGILLGNTSAILNFNGVTAADLTKALRPLFNEESGDYLDPDYISNLRIVCAKNDIVVSYTPTGQATNSRTLWIKRDSGVVEGLIDQGFVDLCVDGKTKHIYGLTANSKVCRLFYGTDDDGTAIAWHFQTKDFAVEYESIVSAKQGIKAKIDCNPNGGTITVAIYMDGSLVQTRTITGASRATTRWRLPDRTFHRISYKVSGSGLQYFYGLSDNITEGEI